MLQDSPNNTPIRKAETPEMAYQRMKLRLPKPHAGDEVEAGSDQDMVDTTVTDKQAFEAVRVRNRRSDYTD